MKQLISFIQKEFRHILRDRTTVMILLLMPIIQIILFGFALTTEVKNTEVAVLVPTNDEVTDRIVDKINASAYFDVVQNIHGTNEIETVFRDGKAKLVVVFENHFAQNPPFPLLEVQNIYPFLQCITIESYKKIVYKQIFFKNIMINCLIYFSYKIKTIITR